MTKPPHNGPGIPHGDEAGHEDLDALIVAIYDDVRRVAHALMRQESPGNTLQPTALANEAIERVYGKNDRAWTGQDHVLAVLVTTMRRTLVDRARKRRAAKRGGGSSRVSLEAVEIPALSQYDDDQQELLDRALEQLQSMGAELAAVAHLKLYGGLSIPQIVAAMGRPMDDVEKDWTFARTWLKRELSK